MDAHTLADDAGATRCDLRQQGLSDGDIDTAIRSGRLVTAPHGLLVARARAVDFATRCRNALETQDPAACLFGRTAAGVHRLTGTPERWSATSEPIHVAAPREDLTRSRRRGLERHLSLVPADDVVVVAGLPLTSVARTLVELARTEARLLVLQLADAAIREGRVSRDELARALVPFDRLRHVCRARTLVRLARDGVDSPGESTARLLIIDAGLPEPTVAVRITEVERQLARADLAYEQYLIWIEYDGWEWHLSRDSFRADRHRDRWLQQRGWQVLRLTDQDLRSPSSFLAQLAGFVAAAPARVAALSPTLAPEVAVAHRLLGLA